MPGGRPRKYLRPEDEARVRAERERARRALTMRVDRAAVAELMQAVEQAAAAGNAIAQLVQSSKPGDLLRNLAHWFQAGARPTG